jgi:hypothetical protein
MADIILTSAATIAREWSSLAIAWHIAAIALLIAIMTRAVSVRGVGVALSAPLICVAALAGWSGNPFNTIVFAIAGALILQAALQLSIERARPAYGGDLGAGVALSVFALVYPHFLDGSPWQYLYAAPLGLLPCPTLAFLLGMSLIVPGLASRRWISVLAPLGAIYGVIGVFMLGVTIDWVLLAGAALLGAKRTAAADRGIDHSDLFKHRRTV